MGAVVSPLRRRYRRLPLGRPEPAPGPDLEIERSAEACPRCGRHALSLIDFPQVAAMGVQPYAELLGMGEVRVREDPGIGCLRCGAEWPDLAAFRRAQDEAEGYQPLDEP